MNKISPSPTENSDTHSANGASTNFRLWFSRPILFFGLLLSIPAFYLLLGPDSGGAHELGRSLYALVALILTIDTAKQCYVNRQFDRKSGKLALDVIIIIACVWSVFPAPVAWKTLEWLFRLALCALILLRLGTLVLQRIRPSHMVQMLGIGLIMLSTAGAGFYYLEPTVESYADGVWLAFTTVATVGYGDIVPSTPASKIFAVFIVILGYAVFSIVTANIAALFVGEEEQKFERELHRDMRALHQEVLALREELRKQDTLLANYVEKAQSDSD